MILLLGRIIAGKWRSRKIAFPHNIALRATPDRARETLFNWLEPDLTGKHCLDLFAGSGLLGLEALSRGAQSVCFVDNDQGFCRQLRKNIATLGAQEQCNVECCDVLRWLKKERDDAFDVAFVDPPYRAHLWGAVFTRLSQYRTLRSGALVYTEHPRSTTLLTPDSLQCLKRKNIGDICIRLYAVRS